MPGESWQRFALRRHCRFNPRPALMPGESLLGPVDLERWLVSIHARH